MPGLFFGVVFTADENGAPGEVADGGETDHGEDYECYAHRDT